jgi:long-chain acyl-CoA synthetase
MAYFGILYAGCTVVPINVLLAGEEVQYHLQDSDAKLLVAHSFFRGRPRTGPTTS